MSKVTVLKTKPSTVLEDYKKLMHTARYEKFLPKKYETIIKLNLSWSLYYPACSTQPWQLEGVLKTMKEDGYEKIRLMENKTVVTDVWEGAIGNKWLPIIKKYGFKYESLTDVEWIDYKPKSELLALDKIFEEGYQIPKIFMGKNILHLPTVKCVHPDTEIMLFDGTLTTIKNIVEEIHSKNEVVITNDKDIVATSNHNIPTLSTDGKIMNGKAIQFWKTPSPRRVIKIKTKTGHEAIVSEVHPFLTPDGWKKANEIVKDTRIAILRKIKIKGKRQLLPQIKVLNHNNIDINKIIFRKTRKLSIETQKKIIEEYLSGKTTTKIAKELGLHYESIRSILLRYNVDIRWVRKWISVPKRSSTDFWRWLGYFIAEGYAKNCNGSMRFWWSNENKLIITDYITLTKKLFGIIPKLKKRRNYIGAYYFDSNNIINFFERLGLNFPLVAETKKVPLLLFKCTNKEIAAFLQGYLDGDGTVAKDGLHATSKSYELIKKIQLLLSRFGVVSFIKEIYSIATNGKMKEKQLYWKISIYGDYLTEFSKHIRFYSKNKQDNLDKLIIRRKKSNKPSNWDIIPVNPEIFRRVREGLNFTQNSSGKASRVNSIENYFSLPTRQVFNYFTKLFKKKDKGKKFGRELEYFTLLASQYIAWDYIEEIKELESETSHLYDLSVPETNNFIGNGLLLHNTHGHTVVTGAIKNAFGGLITEKRHHCHKMIHEILVDLLIVQKEIHKGIFAVVDGTVCGNGNGPRTMEPVIKNYILASDDQVAVDAVAAKMMGFDPMKIGFIKMSHDKGLGIGDINQIDIIGENITNVNFNFKTGRSPVIYFDQLFRQGTFSFLEPVLFHTGIFALCIFGSEFYHDYLWYPTVGKIKIRKFMKTEWGSLFKSY